MKRILVTGASGFIGSHLVERLVEMGFEAKAFVHYNSRNSLGWLDMSRYRDYIEILRGDIRDYDSVSKAMNGCDSVFHLAALIGIPYSYETPLAYIKTNVEGTYNILENARMFNYECVVITSTSETYGTAQFVPISESHPLVGQSPYAASKIAAEQLSISYHRSFGVPVKIVRPFNTYGPRQSARAIIPTIITQILSGAHILELGNLMATRDFTYILDTIEGFIQIANAKHLTGEIVNLGTNCEISVRELANMIMTLAGSIVEIKENQERLRPPLSEVERLWCDNTKLMRNTNWSAKYSLVQGLRETLDWFKTGISNYTPGVYST